MTAAKTRTAEEELLHRKQRLAATLRLFARFGLAEGVGGHVTARDPRRPDRFWINPFGTHFGHVRVSDLLLVDEEGAVVEGEGRVNPAGYTIHSAIHRARPETVAAAHTHSLHGRAFASLGRRLLPICQDACAFFEDHTVFDGYSGVVLAEEEGARIAEALGAGKAVILRNHGLLTVGGSVEEAAWWFIAMDRACQVQLLAEAAGTPSTVSREAALSARADIGAPWLARLSFRSLYADLVRAEPDFLD